MLSSRTVYVTDNSNMEQSLSSAVASVPKKVLVDFIQQHLWRFKGLDKFQNKTKEELYALIALHSDSSLYHWFLQETKGTALQNLKGKQKKGAKSLTSIQDKYTTKPPSAKDIELEQAVNELEVYDVFRLLEEGANPNMLSTKRNNSLLGIIILKEYNDDEEKNSILQIAELLLHYGATCELTNYENCCELPKNIELLEMLLQKGVHPDTIVPKVYTQTTLLLQYVMHDDNERYINQINLLINFGADVLKHDIHGNFPLEQACSLCRSQPQLLLHMLRHSMFDLNNIDKNLTNCEKVILTVCYDIKEDEPIAEEIISLLITKGCNINDIYVYVYDNKIRNPLYNALVYGRLKLARILLQHGALVYDVMLQTFNKHEEKFQWILQYMRQNNIGVVPYQPVKNTSETTEALDDILPSILPADVQQHIWNIKEQLEYECEPISYRTFSIHYTIPYINHRFQATKFAAENCSDVRGKLRYCKSFSTKVVIYVDNYTYGCKFTTTFHRVTNLDEDKLKYYVDFLTQVWGATDIRHVPLFILRHGKSEYTCAPYVYEDIQPKHITQKVNEIVNKCVELLRLKKVKFNEVSHRETQRQWLFLTIERLRNVLNKDDKSILDILQRVEPYKVLDRKGICIVSIDEKSTLVGHTWQMSWETCTLNISPEEDEYNYVRHLNKELKLMSKEDYVNSSKAHKQYIENPVQYFREHNLWKGWYDFLGVDTSQFLKTKEEWVRFCKEKHISSLEEYILQAKVYKELPERPDEVYHNFSSICVELGLIQTRRRL